MGVQFKLSIIKLLFTLSKEMQEKSYVPDDDDDDDDDDDYCCAKTISPDEDKGLISTSTILIGTHHRVKSPLKFPCATYATN